MKYGVTYRFTGYSYYEVDADSPREAKNQASALLDVDEDIAECIEVQDIEVEELK